MRLIVRCVLALTLITYVTSAMAAVTVTVNGANHTIPQTNEKGWGNNVTAWIQAISLYTLQNSGGAFTLTADTNFGSSYGLVSTYYKSRSSNISTAGILRLANTDSVGFRNNANGANLLLGVDSSDRLTFNGNPLIGSSSLTASRLLVSDASGVITATSVTTTEAGRLSGVGSSVCGISDTCTFTNKTLTAPIISTISNTGTLTLPTSTDTLVGKATTDTLTNKTINADGTGNSITNIENADIKAAAAIAVNKLAAVTASRAVASDGSGFLTASSATATELGYLSGVTSAIQTQINGITGTATEVRGFKNVGVKSTITSNTLVIELKNADLSSDCSGGSPCTVSFRHATLTTGGYETVAFGAASSLTLAAADSIGATASAVEHVFVYAVNDTTDELCASLKLFDDTQLQSATALTGGADTSATTLYCTNAHTSKPIRLLGSVKAIWSNPNWGTISVTDQQFSRQYTLGSTQIFTASGTWTRPAGVKAVKITVTGGGGGGGGVDGIASSAAGNGGGGGGGGTCIEFITRGLGATETVTIGAAGAAGDAAAGTGGTGGTSSFGAHCSATGGAGGVGEIATTGRIFITGGAGGTSSGGDINLPGGPGHWGIRVDSGQDPLSGAGGNSIMGFGGQSIGIDTGSVSTAGNAGSGYGGGGSGAASQNLATNVAGGAGTAGIITVEEYY